MTGSPQFYEAGVDLPLATRAASVTSPPMRPQGARGLLLTIYVKTAGTGTLTFRVVETDQPQQSGTIVTVNVVLTTAGVYQVVMMPGAAAQPSGEVAVTTNTAVVLQVVGIPPGDRMRGSWVKSDGSDWTWGASVRRIR